MEGTQERVGNNYKWVQLASICIVITVTYLKIFDAGFMAWDDAEYVLHNRDIRSFSSIPQWFSTFYIGNYHPLTMLSYAVDYALGGIQPLVYHITSLLLHIASCLLLYGFIKRLSMNAWVAFAVALLFGVHPMHTESVSWIAERKTVLSGFLYLLALWQYTGVGRRSTGKSMWLVTATGICAMLSKGTAVSLPLAMLAVDIWQGRDMKEKTVWLPKLPLFVCSLILGIVAIKAQSAGKFLNLHPETGGIGGLVYAGYAFVQYIVRLLLPVRLSVIYPYPQELGILHYVFLLLSLGIIALGFIAYSKGWRVLSGGIIFYTVNIVFLLQFIQVGEVLMADRYMYIACIGIIYPLVHYLFAWLQRVGRQVVATAICGALAVALAIGTFVRNDIWLTDLNFFNAILETFPDSGVAQYSVGALYMKMGNYQEAERRLTMAVLAEPGNHKAWQSRGALYLRQGKPMEALEALNKSLELKENTKAYFTRAMLYEGTGKPELAIADIDKVLAEQPENARAWYIKGDCLEQLNHADEAIGHYSKAVLYEADEPLFYIRRGLLLARQDKVQAALNDLNKAVELRPGSGEALYYRGMVKHRGRQSPCADLQAARAKGYAGAQAALDKLCGGANN